MKLLIPVFSPATGTWGGLTRVIAVAQAAQDAGCAVAFCASGELRTRLKQRGFTVFPTPSPTMFGLPAPLSRMIERRSQRTELPVKPGRDFGNIWFVLLLSGMAQGSYLNKLIRAEQCALEEFQADFLFTDLDPGAFIISRVCNLPIAAAYQTPMQQGIGSLPWKLLNRAVGTALKKQHYLPHNVDQLFHGPQVLKIIPSIPELEGTDAARHDVMYVGQLLGDIQAHGEFRPEAGKKYIFTYLGTGAVSLVKARAVLPKVFAGNGRYICLAAAQSVTRQEQLGGVQFVPYVPAAEVMPYCDWVICHAGQNTIIQALVNQVPLMLFPGPIFERRFNARKVQAAGAGLMGETTDFNPEWILSALDQQPVLAKEARRLGNRIGSFGGAAAAIAAMGQWSKRGGLEKAPI